MFAFLPVFKPSGISSRRIVDLLEDRTGEKVGHAGTLDPLASGVLLTAIGPATRLIQYTQPLPKGYVARFQLGMESKSDDAEREPNPVPVPRIPEREELSAVVAGFTGEIEQIPPTFSAVKINGNRAYRLASSGVACSLPARRVTIHSIRLIVYEFPFFSIDVTCGSGTYVRSLGRDIAQQLGTKCVMVELCRTRVGPFESQVCASMEDVRSGRFDSKLVDPKTVLTGRPIVRLPDYDLRRVEDGAKYAFDVPPGTQELLLTDESARLQAILRPAPNGLWRPALNFCKYWRKHLTTQRTQDVKVENRS